jgi:uncharacterized damage-inducible protein DinB
MRIAIAFALALGSLHAQNLTASVQRYFAPVRKNLEASADAMPADKYNYRLTEGQMSFGEWLIHSAQRNYSDCATLKGEAAPEVTKQLAAMKSKEEISKALKDSFAYCAPVLEHPDEAKILASPQMTYAMLHTVVHNNEIYGNIVGYLRSSGIVPPSTAGRGAQTKK